MGEAISSTLSDVWNFIVDTTTSIVKGNSNSAPVIVEITPLPTQEVIPLRPTPTPKPTPMPSVTPTTSPGARKESPVTQQTGFPDDPELSNLSREYLEEENWQMYLRFTQAGISDQIDPVFKRRLAAYARDNNAVLLIGSGFRSYERQEYLYYHGASAEYDSDGNFLGNPKAAKPGSSWHEYGMAIDIYQGRHTFAEQMLKLYENDATEAQTDLLKYGIFKPFTEGNGYEENKRENWHIQPIETWEYEGERSKF